MKTIVYLHASKDSMAEKGRQIGLTGEALDYFVYACNEVEVTLDVNEVSGSATIIAVDGRPVAEDTGE